MPGIQIHYLFSCWLDCTRFVIVWTRSHGNCRGYVLHGATRLLIWWCGAEATIAEPAKNLLMHFPCWCYFSKNFPPSSSHTLLTPLITLSAQNQFFTFVLPFFFCFFFGINYLDTLGKRSLSRSQNKLGEWHWQSYLWGRLPFVIPAPRTATINKQTFDRAAKWQLTQEREWQELRTTSCESGRERWIWESTVQRGCPPDVGCCGGWGTVHSVTVHMRHTFERFSTRRHSTSSHPLCHPREPPPLWRMSCLCHCRNLL